MSGLGIDEFTTGDSYTNPVLRQEEAPPVCPEIRAEDIEPAVIGLKPHFPRQALPLAEIEKVARYQPHSICSFGNIIWSVLIGWWVALFYVITGILFVLTIYGFQHGLYCFRMAAFIIYPFGRYACESDMPRGPENKCTKFLWILFFPFYAIPALLGVALSWEFVYFIPMAKFLWKSLALSFQAPTQVEILKLENMNPRRRPLLLTWASGSKIYFSYSVMSFEVVYLNFIPFVIISLIAGFVVKGHEGFGDPMFGSLMSMLGAVPCAYLIGICVDELSHQLGLVLGAILNSIFLALVELILYYFSLEKGLADVVRSAVTGAFLMNLLIIPGVGMLAAGIKWNEVILNRTSQSISGTFLLLAIIGVLFPSIFYHVHSSTNMHCDQCTIGNNSTNLTELVLAGYVIENQPMECSMCRSAEFADYNDDPFYGKYAGPLMWIMSGLLPVVYVIGMVFSLKTHKHIFENPEAQHEQGISHMNKWVAIGVLLVATVMFSLMAHVMTEKIPEVIDSLGLSERFVGLVFYTLIPNAAEYMNAIKFALNGNIGLSMEIGNQGAILTAMIEMPALVVLSYIVHKLSNTRMFTLIFPLIDIFCVITAVFLRNSILTEKAVNWVTGTAFLLIFLLISVVYYFEFF